MSWQIRTGPCGVCKRSRTETRFWAGYYRCVECEMTHRSDPARRQRANDLQMARYHRNPEKQKEISLRHYRLLRWGALTAYAGPQPKCACCGEATLAFLAVDHIGGGGNKHRREMGLNSGFAFYRWLKREDYPSGFRVLCHNCNAATAYGPCPHEVMSINQEMSHQPQQQEV